jgi:hypothetical protein
MENSNGEKHGTLGSSGMYSVLQHVLLATHENDFHTGSGDAGGSQNLRFNKIFSG